ncbi:MAG: pyrroline-5-carboxylate reductase [Candidatus Omnitrophota bacterium]
MKLKIGIIGFGNMGKAFALALKKEQKSHIFVYDKDRRKYQGIQGFKFSGNIKELAQKVDIVILAVKPQDLAQFLKQFGECLKTKLLISIAAGITFNFFQKYIKKPRLIRAMPNLAAKIKSSVSFICKGEFAAEKDLTIAKKIFLSIGEVIVTKENRLNEVTALSGSGPGYVFYFMDSIYKAALKLGFNKKDARKTITQVFLGASKLAKESKEDFQTLVKGVASKHGTTEAALKVFEQNKIKKTIENALDAACKRASEMAK